MIYLRSKLQTFLLNISQYIWDAKNYLCSPVSNLLIKFSTCRQIFFIMQTTNLWEFGSVKMFIYSQWEMVKIFVNINVLTKSSSVYFFFLFVFEFSHLEMHVNHTQIWHLLLSFIIAVINYTIVHSWCHLRVNVSGNSLSLSRNKNIFVFSC